MQEALEVISVATLLFNFCLFHRCIFCMMMYHSLNPALINEVSAADAVFVLIKISYKIF